MPRLGISITKSVAYRGGTQEFSNVYFYTSSSALPSASEADTMIDQVKAVEVPFHSTLVSFVRGRLWSQGGTPGTNDMISQKALTGTGSSTADSSMDKERAFLAYRRAGTDSRGKPVYLRKWYHACGTGPGGVTISTGKLAQTTSLTTTEQNSVGTAVSGITPIGTGGAAWVLCSKTGRQGETGFGWIGHKWLEHHQLGDQWRSQ